MIEPLSYPMPFKQWLYEMGERLHIKPQALYMRMSRGKHPLPKIVRKNRGQVFVTGEAA